MRIARRSFLCSTVVGPTLLAVPPRMNIVFILADDLGGVDLGCYGADLHETPHIDRLARQGMRFTNAFSAAPVCSPTRASIMTGKHPARLRMTIWSEGAINPPRDRKPLPASSSPDLPLAEVTIAERLRDRGFRSASVGKWHLGGPIHYPEAQGFDVNIGGSLWGAPPTYFYPYRGALDNTKEIRYVPGLSGGKTGEYLTDRLTDEGVRFLQSCAGEPFFLYLAHHSPHTPIEAKAEKIEKYKSRIRPSMQHRNATYAAMLESLDEGVGRILAEIDRLGQTDRTIVVFTSDNGGLVNPNRDEAVTDNAPFRSGKGTLHEGGIRTPLIVRWPGVTHAGSTSEEMVVSTDLNPTLLGDSASTDGLSLLPLLNGSAKQLSRDALFFHYPHYYPTTTPVSAIRTREWKLLHYYEDGHDELYHLRQDPSETQNRAAAEPERAADLRRRLEAWLQESGARKPVPNPDFRPTA